MRRTFSARATKGQIGFSVEEGKPCLTNFRAKPVQSVLLNCFWLICLVSVLGGKGEGAAGIFEAWDVNHDGEISVQEVCFDLREECLSGILGVTLDLKISVKIAQLRRSLDLAFPSTPIVGHTYMTSPFLGWDGVVWGCDDFFLNRTACSPA